jgi:probable rRNA maturation factor
MIEIQDQQVLLPSLAAELTPRMEKLLVISGLEDAEVSVLLCDDEEIQALNEMWRGVAEPTDVLSFPLEGGDEPEIQACEDLPDILGDIVISVETCIRQAQEYGHSPLDEATRLWIHGFLHLCGYDHITAEEASEMRAKELEFLSYLSECGQIQPLVSEFVDE